MIFLDTHALVFLFSEPSLIPPAVRPFLDASPLVYSPMARLELDFLHEVGRIKEDPRAIIATLERSLDLRRETEAWDRAAEVAATLAWTHDPFDRLITAHALVWAAPFLTRDRNIRHHYPHAFWEAPPSGPSPAP